MTNQSIYADKTILVTGGAGSIGKMLVRKLIPYSPRVIRIYDNNEDGLHKVGEEFHYSSLIRLFVGDIRDKSRLNMAMEKVDIVFHAAALKHVPLCENNPFEAVKTNIIGTQNLIETAFENQVQKVVTISTDKATAPVNVMGATKLLAEKLTIAANTYKGHKPTLFSCVRFGNVLGSRGSVIPVFTSQIATDNEINITDPKMTRFIMRIEEAVQLVLQTVENSIGGEIFVLKMPALTVADLAKAVINLYSKTKGIDASTIKINTVGRREGEKTHEELITENEIDNGYLFLVENAFVMIQSSIADENKQILDHYQAKFKKIDDYNPDFSSETTELLTVKEIESMIEDLI